MNVKQIYSLVNLATKEILGESAVVAEDLTNVVDIGTAIFNANAVDNYVKNLVDQIGRVVFVDRKYSGGVPSVLMDGWEYGSVLEKIRTELPEATVTEDWELQDGASYDPYVFHKPKVSAKFFNARTTFEIDVSITRNQVKESFTSVTQLNGFISMIYTAVENSLTIKTEALVMRTINNMTAATLKADYENGGYTAASGVKAINLLYLYNQTVTTAITAEDSIHNPDFIRFAAFTISLYKDRIARASKLFNIGGKENFTTADRLHFVALTDFDSATKVFLQSDTYHKDLVALPAAETVPYWQGSGTAYDFDSVSAINVKTSGGDDVTTSGILAVMFDRDALGVCNINRRVNTDYSAKGDFYNNFYKNDAGYFNDYNENFIVFFVA